MSKVYGYCRVALANEEEMMQQCKMIQDYCESNGLKVDECFCDNGVSGLQFERDGLQRMLRVLHEGDIVIIKDAARLSRDLHQYMELTKLIYGAGAVFKIINQ